MTTSVTDFTVATLKASGSAVYAPSSGEDAPIELAEASSRQMEAE